MLQQVLLSQNQACLIATAILHVRNGTSHRLFHQLTVFLTVRCHSRALCHRPVGSSWAFRKQIQHVQVNNLILASSCSVLWTLPLLYFQCCPFITFFSLKYQGWIVQAEASQAGGGSLRDCCEERALLFIVGDGALPPLTSLVDYSSMSTDLTCRTCQECLPCGLALCWLGQHLCQHRRCSRSLRLSKEKLPLSAQAAAKHQAGSPQLLPPKLLLTTNKW